MVKDDKLRNLLSNKFSAPAVEEVNIGSGISPVANIKVV